ncbi:tRNA (adenosine(37)-N6)-dimethylallyltransferase MiaA [Flavobacterium sp. ASW18X]|uniref:tRNA (adenosine(37)-N6)-dimethylallyltransferase MiaA n=1 Tax=Flavobacterium sp. ASW18X TaxID=2572595 RepID=UPI0010AE0E1E|nr:tRNA (adenosine(37)-N6)-dimethylallyltransferase MiaA [Flavobacterium sp. ASW18X]TKD65855.1 tRNA (adenosine(37)-N6)-dimethylallyltransferase MiaA [Flavobacterium sp. ASW18X]
MKNKTVIAIVGPTAIGKTRTAISIAKHLNTEIISADSRQFYKEMCIGTAVPTAEELASAPHHFIQHKSINEPYSVGDFERDAIKKIQELFTTHNTVVVVGGSGLYVDAILYGLDEFPTIAESVRKELNETLEKEGISTLQDLLKEKDPNYHQRVDIHNPHRIIRALEVCIGTGKPYSEFLKREKKTRPFNHILIGLEADRKIIYDRINRRVDLMLEMGQLEEVQQLLPFKGLNALQTVGYRELFAYLEGNFSLEDAIEEIKKNTRRFAKRQLTWYRKNKEICWIPFDISTDKLKQTIDQQLT